MNLQIRPLDKADATAYQQVRLRALREHPEAFGSAYEDEQKVAPEVVAERITPTADRFILGAWQAEQLVGISGFGRNVGLKTRHRGGIYSMYVVPEVRRQGVGAALLNDLLQRARNLEGLEELVLAVTVGNEGAKQMYLAAGFEPSHVEKRYIKLADRYYDLDWLTLHL